MMIDELFNKYPENIIGFRINNNIKIIDVWIPNNWIVLPEHEVGIKLIKVKAHPNGAKHYYTFASEDPNTSFMELFNKLQGILEYNIKLIKKNQLLSKKISQLKEKFDSLDYEVLENLSFVIEDASDVDTNSEGVVEDIVAAESEE